MSLFGFHLCMDEVRLFLPALPAVVLIARGVWLRLRGELGS